MAYVSLYRKFRPTSFSKVIGQQHIVRTLANQLKSGNVSHAYLFTGSRGTGKTSVAKIFARAVNCLSPEHDGSPCGKCSVCEELSKTNSIDILEIDAASNNGVDEIRDLRDNVKYLPAVSKYKVYIIDEVHMLSNQAFNALLKTLEEPPEHVIFILATTEVQKIPATILSRCMRFDFRLLTMDELVRLLQNALDGIGKKYEYEALTAIADAGQGSARDTLSLADMCVSYCDDIMTYSDVIDALGICSPELILRLTSDILQGNIDGALRRVNEMYAQGKSIATLAKDVAKMLSDVSYAKNCTGAVSMLKLPPNLYDAIKEIADNTSNAKILHAMQVFCYLDGDLRYSASPKVMLEMAVIKAAELSTDFSQDGILKRIKALEDRNVGLAVADRETVKTYSETENLDGNKIWRDVIYKLRRESPSVRVLLDSYTPECVLEGNKLAIYMSDDNECRLISAVYDTIKSAVNRDYPMIADIDIKTKKKDDKMESQIDKLKNLAGSDRVTVIKGGKEYE